ncbi:MAG: M42 family metallopeptidase, partial [Christensenellaceae bacterium]|nr:M42 family metallopeptidase [Christensenellaceae bacterium]
MDKLNSINNIKMLSNAKGISGFEDEVVSILKGLTKKLGTNKEDSIRNLYVYREGNTGNKPIVQLDAHTDEVGFVVQAIKPNGLIRFLNVGSWITHNIPAHKVLVRNKFGKYVPGIVSSTPPHFMSEAQKNQPLDLSALFIDVGARSDEEVRNKFGIRIGEPVVPMVDCTYDEENDIIMGKAFDCRIGCAVIVDTLDQLKGKQLKVDVLATFSSQEEVGGRGSKLNSQHTNADIAIVFEGCPADDNFAEPYMVQTALKKGP